MTLKTQAIQIISAKDGYGDTVGGKEKKLMTKRFKEILVSIQNKTIPTKSNIWMTLSKRGRAILSRWTIFW